MGIFAYDGRMAENIGSGAHSYAFWDANSEITLCNVPWDSNYRDVVRFDSEDDLDTYIDGLPSEDRKVITKASYVRVSDPISFDDPFNTVSQYNYIRVRNTAQKTEPSEPDKSYYYFITSVRHIAPNNTQVTVQLDVISTYIYGVEFGKAYVERGHVGIANRDNFTNFGNRYLTVHEGLDTGDVYENRTMVKDTALKAPLFDGSTGEFDLGSAIIVFSTIDLNSPSKWGDENGPAQPVPSPRPSFGVVSPLSVAVFRDITVFAQFMGLLEQFPWVAAGIVDVRAIPDIKRYLPTYSYGGAEGYSFPPDYPAEMNGRGMVRSINLIKSWRESEGVEAAFGGRYAHLKKFLTAPYTMLEMTADSGNSITLRPELFSTHDLWIREVASIYLGDMSIRYHPGNYNNSDNEDLFTMISELPALGTVNDNGAIAIANMSYMREFATDTANIQLQNATASQRANARITNSQANATRRNANAQQQSNTAGADLGTTTNTALTEENIRHSYTSGAGLGAAGGAGLAGRGGAAGAVGGAALGAGLGVLSAFINQGHVERTNDINNQNLRASAAIANDLVQRQAGISMGSMGEISGINNSLAGVAAQNDHYLAIQAIEAQEKTAGLAQPSMGAQRGGEIGRYVDGLGIRARVKTISDARIRSIGEYWLRFGYAIHSFMDVPSELHTMSRFTYWKMLSTYIRARIPEMHKNAIRGIFEVGVTVWKNPDDIGMIDTADNEPIVRDYY